MLVKICGLQDEATALAAAAAGADFLGFVFAPSRRRITPERARSIIAAVRARAGTRAPRMVGVFVDECPLLVADVAAYCGLDFVQLCGDESPSYLRRLGTPVLLSRQTRGEATLAALAPYRDLAAMFLLDAASPAARGGTGRLCDWATASLAARRYPVLLAGGLTPTNVADAIAAVRPAGVDVSSGVETDGGKDPDKIAAFIREAKQAGPAVDGKPKEKSQC
jgi:phosphoribosylanthranilate isomerase